MRIEENARDFLQERLAETSNIGVRLHVVKAGCAGYSVTLDYVNEVDEDLLEFDVGGIRFFTEEENIVVFTNANIYLEISKFSTVVKFAISSCLTCGCGSSFKK